MNLKEDLFKLNQTQELFGQLILQSHAALFVYEQLLREYRSRVNWVCEIGTGTGILSLYWALWCRLANVPFLTIDNQAAKVWNPTSTTVGTLTTLGARVLVGDCFSPKMTQKIDSFIQEKQGFLFCDGGNKAEELRVFAPKTRTGTIVVAHDWPIEIDAEEVAQVPEVDYIEPWHTQSLEMGTKAAIMVRV